MAHEADNADSQFLQPTPALRKLPVNDDWADCDGWPIGRFIEFMEDIGAQYPDVASSRLWARMVNPLYDDAWGGSPDKPEVSDEHMSALLRHIDCIPDAQEVFSLLDTLRRMGAITSDDCAALMNAYWERY